MQAASHLGSTSGPSSWAPIHTHAVLPGWAVALLIVAILGVVVAIAVPVVRGLRRSSRPARVVAGLIAVWTIGGAIAVFLQAFRPTDDWAGGMFSSFVIVLYGLVAGGVVWATDRTVRRLRA